MVKKSKIGWKIKMFSSRPFYEILGKFKSIFYEGVKIKKIEYAFFLSTNGWMAAMKLRSYHVSNMVEHILFSEALDWFNLKIYGKSVGPVKKIIICAIMNKCWEFFEILRKFEKSQIIFKVHQYKST
jgi:hypothetical protein